MKGLQLACRTVALATAEGLRLACRAAALAKAEGLRLGAWGLGVTILLCGPLPPIFAQSRSTLVDPIRCWRQSSTGAVTIGDSFTVTLTCAVFESEDTQVVPDESRLNVASIQMAPFEILGGAHPPDVRRAGRRFLQYDYQLRIISPDAIGRDVSVPPLTISYRVHSRVGAAAKLEGRDLSYLLPAMPIKVLSLVPADAADIRDASEASLSTVAQLRTRASTLDAVAIALAVLAVGMLVFAIVPLARRSRAAGEAERPRLSGRDVLRTAAARLAEAQSRAAREGWTDETLTAAMAPMRIIAAAIIERPLGEKVVTKSTSSDGRLVVRSGWLRPVSIAVSSSVTSGDVLKAGAARDLSPLRDALDVFTAAAYRRSPQRDPVALDSAARDVINMAQMVARERRWPSRRSTQGD